MNNPTEYQMNVIKIKQIVLTFATVIILVISLMAPWLQAAEVAANNEKTVQPVSSYSMRIHPTQITGRVDEPVHIQLNLLPYPPPAGLFYSVVADVLQKPQENTPKVLPGDRDISVWCPAPGIYQLRIRVNLIAKSSCGGAQANAIDEQEVQLLITE